ncbi:TPA: superantigen-like protein SSL4 [Staphylococcus aureus]|uniref:superantigen-like protein SSL4 n=1 Tax=Staphylococcus aureus TaxID=1280 RepID=UPI0002506C98|nr:superantigen-like protein SSL4 [Staphylococcus aureus]EHT88322.1 superantigen-like protein 11 [Staphylococcus aureus subsp. aureus CIGC345D]EJX2043321.1 superantigen-like protein SSL4 [Staphylococcus aureus]EKF1458799.1 superantigen-like protein SSL4 [Staphylococcus aureus]EKF1527526.1 superantigen-like protein SSL4 [Staphylococcus aureus]EKK3046953.1 superantigen-like protein SSL4 [Staphylococcus aureus]
MKITTIAKTSLALGLLTTGVITTTTQAANATTPSSTKVEAPQSTPPSTKIEAPQSTPPSTKIEAPQSKPNATTPPSTKVEAPQQTANATTPPSTKVTTPPSTNTPQPMQSTKSDTPQSPTTKQVPTEINPKFKDLRAYYTKPSLEFKNEIGIILKKWTTIRFMNVVPDYFIYKIALVGKDDKKYGEGVHRNVDVFVVLEENNYNLEKYSVGGITKSNSKKVDHKAGVRITKEDNKGTISHDVSEFKITKEQISLKELDFKLRKQLIEKNNLYGNVGSGKIVIKMKNGGKYTFELHKKLQENRMADVIDGTNIDNIEVNIK